MHACSIMNGDWLNTFYYNFKYHTDCCSDKHGVHIARVADHALLALGPCHGRPTASHHNTFQLSIASQAPAAIINLQRIIAAQSRQNNASRRHTLASTYYDTRTHARVPTCRAPARRVGPCPRRPSGHASLRVTFIGSVYWYKSVLPRGINPPLQEPPET